MYEQMTSLEKNETVPKRNKANGMQMSTYKKKGILEYIQQGLTYD